MNDESWQKLNQHFAAAVDLPPADRERYVAAITDDEVRSELVSLLASHDGSERFMRKTAVEISPDLLIDNEDDPLIGTMIGNFRVLSVIGHGGMGAVYLGEHVDSDLGQRAAIKLIKRGMDTDFIVKRFRSERRILSRLDHPNIARIFDGGTTADGLPFFVMEYAAGRDLRDHCLTAMPSVADRLTIFRRICDAVDYAHRNLVVHRDLKPSNIVVGDDGTPKLLDFGIAKVLGGDADETERTTTEFRLLTPKYASPEQVRGEPVSTQSDVYSLGVILKEMLSAPTFGGDGLSGELKVIVEKACHDETARRYASAEQFAEDIRRFQDDLPIIAQPDSLRYRGRKFVERHRLAVSAAAIVLLTLFAGVGATVWQARRAESERATAQARFNDVRSLANAVIFDLHDEIQNLPGSTKARRLLIEKALEYLNKLEPDARGDAGLQHELAMAYSKIGDVQGQIMEASLLETDKAVANYRRAIALAESSVAAEPGNVEFRRDLGLIYYRFAEALRGSNDLTEALALEKRSADTLEALSKEVPDDREVLRKWLVSRSGYADVMRESGDLAGSLPIYEQNLKDTIAAANAMPSDIKMQRFLGIAYGGYAGALYQNNEAERGLTLILEAKNIARKLVDADPDDGYSYRNVGVSCESVMRMASYLDRDELADANGREDVEIMENIAKDDPENLEAKYDVASAINNYADFLEKKNRLHEAFQRRERSIEMVAELEKNQENPDLYTADFFGLYTRAARVSARVGQRSRAETYLAKAAALNFDITKTTGEVRNMSAADFSAMGDVLVELGRKQDAVNWYKKAIDVWTSLQNTNSFYPINTRNMADARSKLDSLSR